MPRNNSLRTEQEHQKKAFEVYYSQGTKRTYEKVAAELGVSASTVKLWSRSFVWSARIAERDAQLAREVADRSLQSGVAESERNLKIVRVALLKLAKGIADGKVKMQLGDLDRLIRLEAYLQDPSAGPDWPRTAWELLSRWQVLWDRFSPEDQHAAMDRLFPGWQDRQEVSASGQS